MPMRSGWTHSCVAKGESAGGSSPICRAIRTTLDTASGLVLRSEVNSRDEQWPGPKGEGGEGCKMSPLLLQEGRVEREGPRCSSELSRGLDAALVDTISRGKEVAGDGRGGDGGGEVGRASKERGGRRGEEREGTTEGDKGRKGRHGRGRGGGGREVLCTWPAGPCHSLQSLPSCHPSRLLPYQAGPSLASLCPSARAATLQGAKSVRKVSGRAARL